MDTSAKLREWRLDDLDDLVLYANNYEVAKNLRDRFPHPYTVEHGRDFIKRKMEEQPCSSLAITWNDKVIGNISLEQKDDVHIKNAEIGYWIGQLFWGKGILTSVVPEMVAHAFDSFEIERIYGMVSDQNIASQKVLLQAGFVLEARFEKTLFKFGEYHDELIFAIRRTIDNMGEKRLRYILRKVKSIGLCTTIH